MIFSCVGSSYEVPCSGTLTNEMCRWNIFESLGSRKFILLAICSEHVYIHHLEMQLRTEINLFIVDRHIIESSLQDGHQLQILG